MKNRARFKVNLKIIELLITYSCNLRCHNCQAMLRQAPTDEFMTLEQIQKFIDESVKNNIQWEYISVLGGEPTLHKDVFEIFSLLNKYKQDYSPSTGIILNTNGHGDVVKNMIKLLTEKFDIKVRCTNKTSNLQKHFLPINQAPIDMETSKNHDFSKGCWLISMCGIALDMHGYYPCSPAAAIDRVFGFDIGRKKIPGNDDLMNDLLQNLCSLCGRYCDEINDAVDFDINDESDYKRLEAITSEKLEYAAKQIKTTGSVISPSWEAAFKKWHEQKPILSKY